MCRFNNPKVSKGCDEPIAEEVKEKSKVNFCDYLEPKPDAFIERDTSTINKSQSELDALFELESDKENGQLSAEDEAKRKLNDLFNINNDNK